MIKFIYKENIKMYLVKLIYKEIEKSIQSNLYIKKIIIISQIFLYYIWFMDMKSKHGFIVFSKIYYPIWVNINDFKKHFSLYFLKIYITLNQWQVYAV